MGGVGRPTGGRCAANLVSAERGAASRRARWASDESVQQYVAWRAERRAGFGRTLAPGRGGAPARDVDTACGGAPEETGGPTGRGVEPPTRRDPTGRRPDADGAPFDGGGAGRGGSHSGAAERRPERDGTADGTAGRRAGRDGAADGGAGRRGVAGGRIGGGGPRGRTPGSPADAPGPLDTPGALGADDPRPSGDEAGARARDGVEGPGRTREAGTFRDPRAAHDPADAADPRAAGDTRDWAIEPEITGWGDPSCRSARVAGWEAFRRGECDCGECLASGAGDGVPAWAVHDGAVRPGGPDGEVPSTRGVPRSQTRPGPEDRDAVHDGRVAAARGDRDAMDDGRKAARGDRATAGGGREDTRRGRTTAGGGREDTRRGRGAVGGGRSARRARTRRRPVRLTRRGRLVLLLVLVLLFGGAGLALSGTVLADRPAAPRTAVVQPDDTLWAFARRNAPGRDPYAVIAEIRRLNDLEGYVIHPGQRLVLPGRE
jgi:hypothetical protein